MRVVANLAQEFEEMCQDYLASGDPVGRDIAILVRKFGDDADQAGPDDYGAAWAKFLEEHKHQMIVSPMTGLVLHLIITYWENGQALALQLPTLERMLVRDTISDISDEIKRRSEANGNAVLVADE